MKWVFLKPPETANNRRKAIVPWAPFLTPPGRERKALAWPPDDPTKHHFYGPADASQAQRRPIRTIAMRVGAIDDEERTRGPLCRRLFRDRRMRETDRARDMTFAECVRPANVEQNEILAAAAQRLMHIAAIRLEAEAARHPASRAGQALPRKRVRKLGSVILVFLSGLWVEGRRT
jgi:hypothetical protein